MEFGEGISNDIKHLETMSFHQRVFHIISLVIGAILILFAVTGSPGLVVGGVAIYVIIPIFMYHARDQQRRVNELKRWYIE